MTIAKTCRVGRGILRFGQCRPFQRAAAAALGVLLIGLVPTGPAQSTRGSPQPEAGADSAECVFSKRLASGATLSATVEHLHPAWLEAANRTGQWRLPQASRYMVFDAAPKLLSRYRLVLRNPSAPVAATGTGRELMRCDVLEPADLSRPREWQVFDAASDGPYVLAVVRRLNGVEAMLFDGSVDGAATSTTSTFSLAVMYRESRGPVFTGARIFGSASSGTLRIELSGGEKAYALRWRGGVPAFVETDDFHGHSLAN